MKICQLAAVDFTVYHFLLPLMRAMRDAGHEVVAVCSPGELVDKIEADGFRVVTIEFKRSYNVIAHAAAYGQLVQLFVAERFDLVHVHTPVAALIGRLAAARANVPLIAYTAHGFYFHERQPWVIRLFFQTLEWIGGRYTDVLFTQSEEDEVAARRLRLCAGTHIEAIGNGVDPRIFYPARDPVVRENMRRALGADDDDVVILMVGRIVAEKGYVELFEAMKSIDACLWVVGSRLESDHAARIDHAIEEIRSSPLMRERIRFLGYRNDVAEIMRAADVFTLPSHREGMPRSIIEAMMSGLPVVATNIRGCQEEVIDGVTGHLVPVSNPPALAEALVRLVDSETQRQQMGEAGHQRAMTLYDEARVIDRQFAPLGLGTR